MSTETPKPCPAWEDGQHRDEPAYVGDDPAYAAFVDTFGSGMCNAARCRCGRVVRTARSAPEADTP